jgi:hypothetical protein
MASKHVGAAATQLSAPKGAPGPSGLSDLALLIAMYHLLVKLIDNAVYQDPGVGIGTTTTKARTTASTLFRTDGEFRAAKASTDDLWTLAGATVPVGSFCRFLFLIDSAGAASVVQGPIATTDVGAAVTPDLVPESKALFGTLKVQCTSAQFVPGTTALNAAGITFTFTDGYEAAATGPAIIDPLV